MSTRLLFLVVFLAYALTSGALTKQGSGADPSGTPLRATPLDTLDQGSGFDPRSSALVDRPQRTQ
jgi:hypothetical protein